MVFLGLSRLSKGLLVEYSIFKSVQPCGKSDSWYLTLVIQGACFSPLCCLHLFTLLPELRANHHFLPCFPFGKEKTFVFSSRLEKSLSSPPFLPKKW